MVKFKKLKWKNFLSYGNTFCTYNFAPGNITRITGKNGKGKSSMLEAFHYCLFGKPYRKIKLATLINNINRKGLETELTFSIGKSNFKVKRNMGPNLFEIWKDKKLLDQSSSVIDYQKVLDDFLGFTENIFQQVSIKSLTKYESFINLPKGSKREIIENIFELELISVLKELNKKDNSSIDSKISSLESDEKRYKILIQQEEENLNRLKKIKDELSFKTDSVIKQKQLEINKLQLEINKLKKGSNYLNECNVELKKHQTKANKLINEINDHQKTINELSKKVDSFESKISFMKQKCRGCSKVAGFAIDHSIVEAKNTVIKLSEFVKNNTIIVKDHSKEIGRLEVLLSKRGTINAKTNSAVEIVKRLNHDINKAKKQVDIVIDETNYKQYKTDLEKSKKEYGQNLDQLKYISALSLLLKDDGIKTIIINKYLPMINKILNEYLQKFGINLELEVTSEFDIVINTKFKEKFTYHNFSEGEKKRIDTALLFTFLDFCKLKHSVAKTNVLFIDEFSSGLDADGENTLYEILQELAHQGNLEVITISHSTLIDPDKIDKVYEAKIVKGFSCLEEIIDE